MKVDSMPLGSLVASVALLYTAVVSPTNTHLAKEQTLHRSRQPR